MTKPLISIIIPTYNSAPYIKRALASIVIHRQYNFEIIIIDGGSTDDTVAIAEDFLKKYNVDYLIYVYPASNVSQQRNKGIELAQGDYLMFVDSDDALTPIAFKALIKLLKNRYEAIFGNFLIYNIVAKSMKPIVNFRKPSIYHGLELLRRQVLGIIDLRCWASIYRREFLLKHQIYFDPEKISHEDFDFVVRVLRYSDKVLGVPEYIYVYYYNPILKPRRIVNGIETLRSTARFLRREGMEELAEIIDNVSIYDDLLALLKYCISGVRRFHTYTNLINILLRNLTLLYPKYFIYNTVYRMKLSKNTEHIHLMYSVARSLFNLIVLSKPRFISKLYSGVIAK